MSRFTNLTATGKIKDEYENINSGFSHVNDHFDGSAENHPASDITNDSEVTGTNVDDALNTLKGQADALEVGDSNALIGTYSINASGTDTLTGTYTDLTYFTGLKINLMIANDNTDAVTFNLNSIGAKSVYKVVQGTKTELSPRDLRDGEIAIIEYDGTDFILLNGEREAEYSTETTTYTEITTLPSTVIEGELQADVNGVSGVNLLSDTVAGCEATTGWTNTNSAIATDNSNELEGTNCLKLTISADGGLHERDILSLLDTSKYYLISGYLKNSDLTSVKIQVDCEGDVGEIDSDDITATSYNRTGVVIQPTDFDTATNVYLRIVGTGANTELAYYDALMLREIASADHTAGVDACLAKYPYHRGIVGTDKMRVLSEEKNFVKNGSNEEPNLEHWLNCTNTTVGSGGASVSGDYYSVRDDVNELIQWVKVKSGDVISFQCVGYYPANSTKVVAIGYYMGYRADDMASADLSANKIGSTIFANNLASSPTQFTSEDNTVPDGANWLALVLKSDSSTRSVFVKDIMIEQGSTTTTYEPYKSTQAICPTVLRDVTDGTCDIWDCKTGEVTRKITELTDISDTGYDSIDTATYTNVDVVKTTAFSDMAGGSTSADGKVRVYNSSGVELAEVAQADIDLTASVGKFYVHTDETIWFIVADGTYVDIAAARTGLGTSQTSYEKATYTTEIYQPSTLQAYPSGRFIQEAFISEQGQYNSGLTIADSDYPIANLVYVNKIDIATGDLTVISTSDCTVASGGGSVSSITGASDGEWYDYGYNYNFLSSQGAVDYAYNTNTKAQVASNTAAISNLNDRVTQNKVLIDNINDRVGEWQSYTPTLTWGTADPEGNVATVGRYQKLNGSVNFSVYYTADDGNAADSLTVSLPVAPTDNSNKLAVAGYQKVNATWTQLFGIIDASGSTVTFLNFQTCTDAQAVEIILSGTYEI